MNISPCLGELDILAIKVIAMNTLKSIRTALGMTQQQMADLLFINRSTVSMVECGLRSLPVEVSPTLKLIAAQAEKFALDEAVQQEAAQKSAWMKRTLQRRVVLADWKRERYKKRLQKMSKLHEATCRFLKFLAREMKVFSFDADYMKTLNGWYEKARARYTRTLPCYRQAIELSVSIAEDSIGRMQQQLVIA